MKHNPYSRYTTPNQTADQRYQELLAEMKVQLKKLENKITQHAKDQKGDVKNWGNVGDMAHWLGTIQNITEPEA